LRKSQHVVAGRGHFEALAFIALGLAALRRGEFDRAGACFEDALAILGSLGDATWPPFVLKNLGLVAYRRGDRAQADPLYQQALAQFRAMGNSFGTAVTLINMAQSARDRGDLARATALYAESLALRWDHGDKISVASCLRGLALVAASGAGLRARPERPSALLRPDGSSAMDDCTHVSSMSALPRTW
jgi:tetratricopeptide (TPR) repeat protein